jgi:hypothetical protein
VSVLIGLTKYNFPVQEIKNPIRFYGWDFLVLQLIYDFENVWFFYGFGISVFASLVKH